MGPAGSVVFRETGSEETLSGPEPEVDLFQGHLVGVQLLSARLQRLSRAGGSVVGLPFPDVPATLPSKAAVGGRSEADERGPTPVGGVMATSMPRLSRVRHLVVIIAGRRHRLVGGEKLG